MELIGKGKWGILTDVLHVPRLQHSMVSIPSLDLDGKYAIFGDGKCLITDKKPITCGNTILEAPLTSRRLYEIAQSDLSTSSYKASKGEIINTQISLPECLAIEAPIREQITRPSEPANSNDKAWIKGSRGYNRAGSTAGHNKLMTLHLRANHCSKTKLLWMLKHNSIRGAGLTYEEALCLELGTCEACEMGNMRAAPIPISTTANHHDKEPFYKISSDPVPVGHKSTNGNSTMVIFVDYSTGFIAAYFAKNRTKIEDYIEQLTFDVIDRYGHTCREILTDCYKVFVSEDFEVACQVMGIHTTLATPYLHRPNYSEAAVNIIVGMIRVLLVQSQLPYSFWELACKYAIYHANRTVKSEQSKTPRELITNEVPDASLRRPFGAKCYCHQTKDETVTKGGKLAAKAQKGVLVGYAEWSVHCISRKENICYKKTRSNSRKQT